MSDVAVRCRLESRQQEIRRRAREALEARYGDGGDGAEMSCLFECPSLAWRLGEDLLELLPAGLRQRLDVVAGTGTAGIILAHTMAGLLDSRRPLSGPTCRFAAFECGGNGPLVPGQRLASCLRERKVLLVDAIYEPGGRLQQAIRLARETRAEVLACAAVWGPRRSLFERHIPLITLCEPRPRVASALLT